MSGKDKGEVTINLTQSELKLIALGTRFTTDNGKVDYEQLAKYGGYTKGSAQVMYRKALRKLTEAFPIDTDAIAGGSSAAPETTTANEPVTPAAKAKTPKTPKSRASSAKKRKDAGGADEQDLTPAAEQLTPLAPGNDFIMEAADYEMATPTKKPKKNSAKQATSAHFTSVNEADNDNGFLKAEPLFESTIKTE